MKSLVKIYFIIFVIFLKFDSICQIQPSLEQFKAWQNFNSNYNNVWKIRWDNQTGSIASIYSGQAEVTQGSPEQMALEFLTQNSNIFGIKDISADIKLDTIITFRGTHHVTFRQLYHGIPVLNSGLTIHISGNKVIMVNGKYYSNININYQPNISKYEALTKAIINLSSSKEHIKVKKSSLVVFNKGNEFKLAWGFYIVPKKTFGAWSFVIDALNGAILQKQDLISYVTGDGNVYSTHPGISSVTQVSLPRLDGSGYLRGTYVQIFNSQSTEAFDDIDFEFFYNSTDTHFDEVNVYYHADRFRHDYLNNLGFTGNGIDPVVINVHDETQNNHPAFDPSDGKIYIPSGLLQGQNDYAKEDKIIYHEYTHVMVYSIKELFSAYTEQGAINEGLADYFAGSFTNRPEILDYSEPARKRDMTNPGISNYNDIVQPYYVEPHDGAEFFSACLWELRNNQSIGQTAADDIIYNALYYLPQIPTPTYMHTDFIKFVDFREALISADYDPFLGYYGAHVPYIECIFKSFGIGGSPVTTSGSLVCNETWSGTVNIYDNVTVPTGISLTIQPGTTVNFPVNKSLTINGKLTAVGTSQNKITFGGEEWWDGIIFNDASDNSSQISYANIYGAVYGIKCYKANPTITWDHISGNQYGVHVTNASPTIKYNYINQNVGSLGGDPGTGIYVYYGIYPNISNNRIFNNTYGIQFVSVAYQVQFNDNDIYDNFYNFFARDYTAPPMVYSGSNNNFYFESSEWYDVGLRNGAYIDLVYNWWDEYPPDYSEFDVDGTSALNTFPELMSTASHSLPKRGTPQVEEEKHSVVSNKVKEFKLFQNYPNPFNPSTIIKYSIPAVETGYIPSLVQLKIYDMLGREIATLVNKEQAPGNYEVTFDASNLSSGIYFYVLRAGKYHSVNKMIYLR